MPYEVLIAREGDLVGATMSGTFDVDDVVAMVTQARARSDETGFHILYDFSAAVVGNVSSSDLFWMPRRLPSLSSPWARRVRVGLVHPPGVPEMAQFWENTFRNFGLDVRAFATRDEAVKWLR